uniref:T9SS type A sorting domain-containing protein n=1 Tax=Flavobacterium sp. TaxID=239 RepID=UPI0040473A4E
MKKIILFVAMLLMGMTSNAALVANLTLNPAPTPSASFPGYHVVSLRVTTNGPGCYGKFSFLCQSREVGTVSWSNFTPNVQQFPFTTSLLEVYSGTAKTLQLEGTNYEYRIRVSFNPQGINGCDSAPTLYDYTNSVTVNIPGVSVPCFTMYNVLSTQNESSLYGPMPVKTICQNAVTINGSCSKFESGYHIRISEFNLTTWSFVSDYYNDWAGTGEAPSFISLNALADENDKYFQTGKLYAVGFSIGPVWKSAPIQFFRVVSCKTSGTSDGQDIISFLDIENDTIDALKLYPNPVKDVLTITVDKEEKIISYEIFDNYGSRVKKEKLTAASNEQNVNLTDMKKGFYIINIETDKGSYKEKIIKE